MRILISFICLLLTISAATADQFSRFQADLIDANDSIKTAGNYMRTGNLIFGEMELETALEKWQALQAKHVKSNLAPYDPQDVKDSMTAVHLLLQEAMVHFQNGQADQAHTTLVSVRQSLHTLNMRNDVITLADRIMASSKIMTELWPFRHNQPNWENAQIVAKLSDLVKAYEDALKLVENEASENIKANPEFSRVVGNMKQSLGRLHDAIATKDTTLMINLLREMRSYDRILYLRFG